VGIPDQESCRQELHVAEAGGCPECLLGTGVQDIVKPERALRSITGLIVRCCDPDAVVLFGSYAKGQENRDSDLDILVISDFREPPHLREHELRELLVRYPLRIDLHLVTPEEMAAELCKPYGFLSSVHGSGMRLYTRATALTSPRSEVYGKYIGRT